MSFTRSGIVLTLVAVAACGRGSGDGTAVAADAVVDPTAPVRSYGADVPLAYYRLSFALSKRTAGITPPVQARAFAYMGLALYESLVAGMPRNRSIASQLNGIGELPEGNGTYYWPLVASAAMAEVMRGLWGDATNVAAQNVADITALEYQIRANTANVQGSLGRRSIDFGHAVGAAVYQTSRDDGEDRSYLTNSPTDYLPPVGPGLWVPLPGQRALQPYWRDRMTPFVTPGSECAAVAGPPPAFSVEPGSAFYEEALEVYGTATHLTPEQQTIARFWADGPGTINGPGHSLSTASEVLVEQGANLEEAAETFARVGIAVADAVLTCWYSKYEYDLIRPITYIRAVIDPAFTPLLPTPPFPEYTSAHSVQTAAALSTLQALFGDVGYEDHTHDADGFATRSFATLSDSMYETGISRLYGGIHFHSAIFHGFDQGRCVSARVNALGWRKD
jgi:hypothetical protein